MKEGIWTITVAYKTSEPDGTHIEQSVRIGSIATSSSRALTERQYIYKLAIDIIDNVLIEREKHSG